MTISNPNMKSNAINKSKVMSIDAKKGNVINPDQNKKRSSELTLPLDEKKAKLDETL